jgi:hypothetical protein
MTTMSFKCPYCNRSYSRESWYRKHNCKQKERFEQVHSMNFIRGLRVYQHWRKRNGFLHKGKSIKPEDFINSPFYTTFINLVKFTSENWVITSFRYLDFLIDRRVPEAQWRTEEILSAYREYIRRNDDPKDQIKETHKHIDHWCNHHEINIRDFFDKISIGQAIELITTNRLSPWILFGYDKAVKLLGRFDDDRLCVVDEFLNSKYWITRIQKSPDIMQSVQHECDILFDYNSIM